VSESIPPPGCASVIVFDPAGIGEALVSASLQPAELEQARRFRFEKDARHWRACRAALRLILGRALHADPAALAFQIAEHGKPGLAPPHHQGLNFNLSHCADLALVALCRSGPVGIDVEAAGRGDCLIGCESSFCHPEEIALLPARPRDRAAALLDLWTSKEALLKALGTGMSLAPESVSLAGGGARAAHPRLSVFVLHALEHPALQAHVARLATLPDIGAVRIEEFTV